MLPLRALLFAILIPGTVTVGLPWLLVGRWPRVPFPGWGPLQLLALLPLACGAAVLLHSIWLFLTVGRGTLAAIDAPRRLVVTGLYRFVRNPMYVAVLTVLLGEALLFGSPVLLAYAAVWLAAFHLFVVLYEEPALERRFGASYQAYRRAVRRWLPGRLVPPER